MYSDLNSRYCTQFAKNLGLPPNLQSFIMTMIDPASAGGPEDTAARLSD